MTKKLYTSILFLIISFLVQPVFANGSRESAAEESANSVVIEHKFGSTVIPSNPERVISIGYTEQDFLLALDIVPIAIRDWYGDQPLATWPWAIHKLNGAEPVVLSSGELDFELIASLAPDLIMGITAGMSEEEYNTLSKIAPVVVQGAEYKDYGTPWNVVTETIGVIFNKKEEAKEIVSNVEKALQDARDNNPEFHGSTAGIAFFYQDLPGTYASSDTRSQFLQQLGFVIPKEYDVLAGDTFYNTFSAERVDLLDTDVLVWVTSTDAEKDILKNAPIHANLPRYSEGRELYMDSVIAGAFGFASPLSIPYIVDALVPALKSAVDGDPNTLAPESFR